MKRDARRVYLRTAFGGARGRRRLQDALRGIERKCYLPLKAPGDADELHRAMAQMIFWPSKSELDQLDSAVERLATIERKRQLSPLWKAYVLVNDRWPGSRLVPRVNALISRARERLNEAGNS